MGQTMGTVIAGVDATPTAAEAAETAAKIAAAMGTSLTLVMAHGAGPACFLDGPGEDSWQLSASDEAVNVANALQLQLREIVAEVEIASGTGKPADVLVEVAEQRNAGLIVVGNRRVQGISRVLGAIATSVIRNAPCDVLVAKTH